MGCADSKGNAACPPKWTGSSQFKTTNVLLFDKGDNAKICDFGSARLLEHTATATGMTGTFRWMAPELNDKAGMKINQRCDVFSYGMILYEIFVHEIPYSDIDDDIAVASSVRDGKRPMIPPELPPYIQELMQSCWEHQPHDRPTFEEILQVCLTLFLRINTQYTYL